MAAASRNSYLGAAIFAVAVVVACLFHFGLLATEKPAYLSVAGATFLLQFYLPALPAAVASFALFNWLGWRLPRGPLLLRGLLFGSLVVVVAHLIYGFFFQPFAEVIQVVTRDYYVINWRSSAEMAFFAGYWTMFHALHITLPIGIAAALLFEWLECRPRSTTEARAVE